jgi:hypothetical protein
MFTSIARFLNMYSGEIGVAICASSSTLVLGYMMDDCYKVQIKKINNEMEILKQLTKTKNEMESLKTEYDTKIAELERRTKLH